MNCELPVIQTGFRKGRETRDQIVNMHWIIKKAIKFQKKKKKKTIYFCFINFYQILWLCANCEKFFKQWEYQTTLPILWKLCMQFKKQQLALDMEQQTGYISGKEYVKAVYFHSAYLTYM